MRTKQKIESTPRSRWLKRIKNNYKEEVFEGDLFEIIRGEFLTFAYFVRKHGNMWECMTPFGFHFIHPSALKKVKVCLPKQSTEEGD